MKIIVLGSLFLLLIHVGTSYGDEIKEKVEKPVGEAIDILEQTQEDKEKWRLLREKLSTELETLQQQVDQLVSDRDLLKKKVIQTRLRIDKKEQQLHHIERIEQEMDPFLQQLVVRMADLPEQHLPFLLKERQKRMTRLAAICNDPEITLSEKYRKAMEALQIEAEYGFNIESSQELIAQDDREVLVNIFRLGRLGLYFVSLDEQNCGYYNLAANSWQPLSSSFIKPLLTATAIAEKRRPVEFIELPLGRMVTR